MRKYIRLILVMALLLIASGVITAQESDVPVFCGDLAAEDCDILTQAQQAALTLESASFDLNADFTISNIPDAPFDSLAFNLTGSGAYASDPSVMADLMEMQGDPSAMLENMEQLAPLFEQFFASLSGQLNLTLTLPSEITDMMSSGDMQIPEQLSMEFRMVDGIGYINLDQIAEAMPQMGVPGGWYGIEVARLIGMSFEQSLSQLDDAAMEGFDASAFSQFTNPEFIGQYATIERLEDEDGAAVFRTTFDYAGFVSSPEFRELMLSQMEATGEEFDEEELDEAMSMMETMFSDITLESTTYIDLETGFTRRMEASFSFDMTEMMAAMGEESAAGAPAFDFSFSIDYSDFNDAPAVEAPEDVQTVITAEQLLQMSGMGANEG
jgi:hypothetical protein